MPIINQEIGKAMLTTIKNALLMLASFYPEAIEYAGWQRNIFLKDHDCSPIYVHDGGHCQSLIPEAKEIYDKQLEIGLDTIIGLALLLSLVEAFLPRYYQRRSVRATDVFFGVMAFFMLLCGSHLYISSPPYEKCEDVPDPDHCKDKIHAKWMAENFEAAYITQAVIVFPVGPVFVCGALEGIHDGYNPEENPCYTAIKNAARSCVRFFTAPAAGDEVDAATALVSRRPSR